MSFILVLITAIVATTVSGSMSVMAFCAFSYLVGLLLCGTIEYKDRIRGYKVLNTVFSVITMFAVFHYLDAYVDWHDFAQEENDEYKFWMLSEKYAHFPSIKQICIDSFTAYYTLRETKGYVCFIGIIAYLAERYFDGNNLLLQLIGSVSFGTFISVILYKIFLLYFNSQKSFKYALLYSLCSAVAYYSFKYYRDIHIAFFYILSLYVVLNRISIKGIIILLCNIVIVWQMRREHGIFLIVFLAYNIFFSIKKNPLVTILFFVILTVVFFVYFVDVFDSIMRSMADYEVRSYLSDGLKENSFGAIIYRFPSPFKEALLVINSQIQPFPSWHLLEDSKNIYSAIVSLIEIVRGVFWFVIVCSIFVWLFAYKAMKKVPLNFKYLMFIVLVFLFANTSNMTERRLICVYPIIFLLYVWLKEKVIHYKAYFTTKKNVVYLYISLCLIYVVAKAFT